MAGAETFGFREAIAAFEQKIAATEPEVKAVVERGALNIKKQLVAEMQRSPHFKGVARGISYDMRTVGGFGGGAIEAEIGPESSGPGALANVAYFGTSRGGGTVPDPQGALEAEAPNVEKYLTDLIEKALR